MLLPTQYRRESVSSLSDSESYKSFAVWILDLGWSALPDSKRMFQNHYRKKLREHGGVQRERSEHSWAGAKI